MAEYGNFLNVWSERYKWFDLYKVAPKVGSGYEVTFACKKKGIIITTTRSKMVNRGGIQTEEADYTLYTADKLDMKNKAIKYKNKWLRAVENGSWNEEGDFCITLLAEITGNVELANERTVTEEVIAGEF